jgi:hypothetical protein
MSEKFVLVVEVFFVFLKGSLSWLMHNMLTEFTFDVIISQKWTSHVLIPVNRSGKHFFF